uniref:Uncharacterized protein n=1 Tax=Arundo donax TaxID=35708 RepID=A0A0A9HQT8_ARUDO
MRVRPCQQPGHGVCQGCGWPGEGPCLPHQQQWGRVQCSVGERLGVPEGRCCVWMHPDPQDVRGRPCLMMQSLALFLPVIYLCDEMFEDLYY